MLCPHATILNHRWLPGTRLGYAAQNLMSGCTCRPFIPVCLGSGSGMQNPLANFIGVFSLDRDVRGFPPSGNGGY